MKTDVPRWGRAHSAVAGGCALAAAVAWLPPLRSSLWLDETGTAWLVRGSLAASIGRALRFQGGSPLYYFVLWIVRALFGTSEAVARLPSVVGMALAVVLLFLLGRRLFDEGAGALAAALLAALPFVAFAAADARPYALAMAALVGNAVALARWLDRGRTVDATVYALSIAAVVYLHFLFVPALLAHAIYMAFRRDAVRRIGTRAIALTYGAAAVLVAPAAVTFLRVYGQRGSLSTPYPMSAGSVATALLPPALVLVVVVGFALAALVWRPRLVGWESEDGAVPFVAGWAAITFLTLVIVSEATSADVMVPRYFVPMLPPIALLTAAVLRRLSSSWPQVAIVAATTAVAIVRFVGTTHTTEDWRAAAALERRLADPSTPVLLFSGFIEARQPDWLTDPEKSSYLDAPATAYDFDGSVHPLPFGISTVTAPYMERLVAGRLDRTSRFVLVTRGSDTAVDWLHDHLSGYELRLRGDFGGQILVYEYMR